MIPVFRSNRARAWPKNEQGERAIYTQAQEAFARFWRTDAHFQVCSLPAVPRRLGKHPRAPYAFGYVPEMLLFVVDVDDPVAHKHNNEVDKALKQNPLLEPKPQRMSAREEWWTAEQEKIARLFEKHSGYCYRSTGGYRLVWSLARPFAVDSLQTDDAWKARYLESLAYLYAHFCIEGDPATSDWTRLFRLPRVTRDRVPQRWPEIGTPNNLGAWEWPAFGETERKASRERTATDPQWAMLAKRLEAPVPTKKTTPRPPRLVAISEETKQALTKHAHLVEALAPAMQTHTGTREQHEIHVRLSGAFAHLGFPRDSIDSFVRSLCAATGDHEIGKRLSDWHGTYALVEENEPVRALPALTRDFANVAEALRNAIALHKRAEEFRAELDRRGIAEEIAASDAVEEIRRVYRDASVGISLLRITEGTGKTRAVADVMRERSPVSLSTARHDVAREVFTRAGDAGVPIVHRRGVLSVLQPDGSPACRFHAQAKQLASAGQNVVTTLCLGIGAGVENTNEPCEHQATCAAFREQRAERNTAEKQPANAFVSVHECIDEAAAFANGGLHVVDEDTELVQSITLNVDDLTQLAKNAVRFKRSDRLDTLQQFASFLSASLPQQPVGTSLRTLAETFAARLEIDAITDLTHKRIVRASVEGDTYTFRARTQFAPTMKRSTRDAVLRKRNDAPEIISASRTFDVLARALAGALYDRCNPEAQPHGLRAKGWVLFDEKHSFPGLRVVLSTEALSQAIARPCATVFADATASAEVLRAMLPDTEITVRDLRVRDGAEITRTLLYCDRSSRKAWIPKDADTQWEHGLVRYLTEAVRVAGVPDHGLLGLITWKRLACEIRAAHDAWRTDRSEHPLAGLFAELETRAITLEIGHYGALRGSDAWKECDSLVILGTPRPNLGAAYAIADAIDVDRDTFYRHAIEAELSQACGRLRTPWREKRGHIVVVADTLPLSWDARARVMELPRGASTIALVVDAVDRTQQERAVDSCVSTRTVRRRDAEKRNDSDVLRDRTRIANTEIDTQLAVLVRALNTAEPREKAVTNRAITSAQGTQLSQATVRGNGESPQRARFEYRCTSSGEWETRAIVATRAPWERADGEQPWVSVPADVIPPDVLEQWGIPSSSSLSNAGVTTGAG